MKSIFIVVMLSGCVGRASQPLIDDARQACAANGGVQIYWSNSTDIFSVDCMNGASFNTIKNIKKAAQK